MPLASVMNHVRNAVDDMVFPTGLTFDGTNQVPNLQAHIIAPYGTTVSDGPHAFVWGGTLHRERQTMGGPRTQQVGTPGAPFHTLSHRVDVLIRYALPLKLRNADSCFPSIIDSVVEFLAGIPMNVSITDPLTSRPSTIQLIGEEFDVTYGQVYAVTDGRYGLFGAKIVMQIGRAHV